MPESNADLIKYRQQQQQQQQHQQYTSSPSSRRHIINIESTVTPSRAPFLRQQSAQSTNQGYKFRPLPPISGDNFSGGHPPLPQQQQHAASFDLATSNSPFIQRDANTNVNQTSYQQKLLQLQLLHNSNNVDYIRHNNRGDLSNDYQIYGPESTNGYGYGYGYSSMRSNLKSAASEFSFIRPSSSSQAQSTLPHPPNHHHQPSQNSASIASAFLNNQGTRNSMRSSLILTANSIETTSAQQQTPTNKQVSYIQSQLQKDSNNNDLGRFMPPPLAKQSLADPLIERRAINQNELVQSGGAMESDQRHMGAGVGPLIAPLRELPMKPNKKRAPTGVDSSLAGNNLPKSSSLTSSIACFFRRAFSRRSKKKKNASKRRFKLAESCSSSLGAFEDGYASGPVVPSAFSTGSKSVDGSGRNNNIANRQVLQSPRMIDMIEAFTNKTHANKITDTIGSRLGQQFNDGSGMPQRIDAFKPIDYMGRLNDENETLKQAANQQIKHTLNQFGSPLHKSNSISATMGLSFANDKIHRNNASLLYDNAIIAASGGSPMLMRSSKVLSANLTPYLGAQQQPQNFGLDHQSFLSPRNINRKSELMPRPSSIYGQPSMISSPVINREERISGNFGIHRSSLHNHHFRDRSQPPSGNFDARRHHHLMKVPYLDTTREVAEELPSPIIESNGFQPFRCSRNLSNPLENHEATMPSPRHYNVDQSPATNHARYLVSASPSSDKLYNRQAIVNPILQSPTMGTIYDNHPMLNESSRHLEMSTSSSSYSHYDNHNQLLMAGRRREFNQIPASPSLHHQQTIVNGLTSSPRVSMTTVEDPYSRNISSIIESHTPSHHRLSSSSDFIITNGSDGLKGINRGNKPSAIIAPTTPNTVLQNQLRSELISMNRVSSPTFDRHHNNMATPQSRSPMLPRRISKQNHYQQSPLASSQTRVLSKGDKVQATVSASSDEERGLNDITPVINIAGAPGINLDPSLAASLLRGTNIDAYQCSTLNQSRSGQSQYHPKTFLVSTRLSKSMAQNHTSNEIGSDSSIVKDESSVSSSTLGMRSSRDELSSSGSRSMNSSIGERGCISERKRQDLGVKGDRAQEQDESSESDTNADNSVIISEGTRQQRKACDNNNRQSSGRSLRESSGEPSDDISSRVGSLEKPDERDWINSKLVE